MKKIFLLITILLCINYCFAQKAVEKKTRLTDFVTERYQTIIQTDKQIKQGTYNALYEKKIVIANGVYTNNKRTGTWHFFFPTGKLLQNYNYTTRQLLYEAPEDTTSTIRYMIDYPVTEKDTTLITKPIRLGGRYYGYVPYFRLFKLPVDMQNSNTQQIEVIMELLVSPLGRLSDFKFHIRYYNDKEDVKLINVNTDLLSDEDKTFIPASRDRKLIASRILIRCYITRLDGIDIY